MAGGVHIMRKLPSGAYQDIGAAGINLNGNSSFEFYADELSVGDWNEDGKLDLASVGPDLAGAQAGIGLWTSALATTNRWLKVQLPEVTGFFTGTATIELFDAGFLGDTAHYVTPPRTLATGNAWASQIYHFGVGTRATVDVRVTFPSGVRNTQINVATNANIVVHPLANVPPTAVAAASPPSSKVGHAISFSGANSADSDGTIIAYAWAFGDGGSASGIAASHAYASPGTYTATLTVTDNSGGTGSAQVVVTVVANVAPVAVAAAAPVPAVVGQAITFGSAGSSDPDGTIVGFAWTFGDGTAATGATSSHSYAAPGSYLATLTVTDDDGATGVTNVGITVNDVVAPTISIASVAVVVTPTVSDDVGVRSVTWSLDGVAQPPTTVAPFSLSFDFNALAPGPHTIAGVAADASGNQSAVATIQISR
jgi:PKD repeat protein